MSIGRNEDTSTYICVLDDITLDKMNSHFDVDKMNVELLYKDIGVLHRRVGGVGCWLRNLKKDVSQGR